MKTAPLPYTKDRILASLHETIAFFDTRERKTKPFAPLDGHQVRMYMCGPTVYDHIHVGNARAFVVFDTLFRVLRLLYGKENVVYVRNITDIDDKIIERSSRENKPMEAVSEKFTRSFHQTCAALHCLTPSHEPCATEYIAQMQTMIHTLITKGYAYENNNHVYFDTKRYANYGELAAKRISQARIDPDPHKRNAEDFVLWKPSSGGIPGWDSPWGFGRPGWHIECSAMSHALLGYPFDIHGGGQDLIFPHHENEMAQSLACGGCDSLCQFWIHNGFVTVGDDKMSKSLGNFMTGHEALREHSGEAIRLCLLQSHYRAPCVVSHEQILAARNTLDGWYEALEGYDSEQTTYDADILNATPQQYSESDPLDFYKTALTYLVHDLNTPEALMVVTRIAKEARQSSGEEKQKFQAVLHACGSWFGLLNSDTTSWFTRDRVGSRYQDVPSPASIEAAIQERQQARAQKDFQKSDAVRKQLERQGISLLDASNKTTWRREGYTVGSDDDK